MVESQPLRRMWLAWYWEKSWSASRARKSSCLKTSRSRKRVILMTVQAIAGIRLRAFQQVKDEPQPQDRRALGLLKLKPPPRRPPLYSRMQPAR